MALGTKIRARSHTRFATAPMLLLGALAFSSGCASHSVRSAEQSYAPITGTEAFGYALFELQLAAAGPVETRESEVRRHLDRVISYAAAELSRQAEGPLSVSPVPNEDFENAITMWRQLATAGGPTLFGYLEHSLSEAPRVQLQTFFGRILHCALQRGDEAVALSSLVTLDVLAHRSTEVSPEYVRILSWSEAARLGPADHREGRARNEVRFVSLLERHALLSPHPVVLGRLSTQYATVRQRLRDRIRGADQPAQMGDFEEAALAPILVERAPVDIAAVYLRFGDLDGAANALEGDDSELAHDIFSLASLATNATEAGDRALLELAMGYARVDPIVTESLCRLGYLRHPQLQAFGECLVEAVVNQGDLPRTRTWVDYLTEQRPSEAHRIEATLARAQARYAQRMASEAN